MNKIIQELESRTMNRRLSCNSLRYAVAPAIDPGNSAVVLVAFATAGATTPVSAGKVNSVPPPATEFMIPATNAEPPRKG